MVNGNCSGLFSDKIIVSKSLLSRRCRGCANTKTGGRPRDVELGLPGTSIDRRNNNMWRAAEWLVKFNGNKAACSRIDPSVYVHGPGCVRALHGGRTTGAKDADVNRLPIGRAAGKCHMIINLQCCVAAHNQFANGQLVSGNRTIQGGRTGNVNVLLYRQAALRNDILSDLQAIDLGISQIGFAGNGDVGYQQIAADFNAAGNAQVTAYQYLAGEDGVTLYGQGLAGATDSGIGVGKLLQGLGTELLGGNCRGNGSFLAIEVAHNEKDTGNDDNENKYQEIKIEAPKQRLESIRLFWRFRSGSAGSRLSVGSELAGISNIGRFFEGIRWD